MEERSLAYFKTLQCPRRNRQIRWGHVQQVQKPNSDYIWPLWWILDNFGVLKGCIVSSQLFNLIPHAILSLTPTRCGAKIGGILHDKLACADDNDQLATTPKKSKDRQTAYLKQRSRLRCRLVLTKLKSSLHNAKTRTPQNPLYQS